MEIYLIEKAIHDVRLSKLTNCSTFSELNFNKANLRDRFNESLNKEFISCVYISLNESLKDINQEGIFWTTNVVFLSLELQKLFIQKLLLSSQSILYGNANGFVFKGHSNKLFELIESNFETQFDYISIKNEKNLVIVQNSYDYKKLILQLPEVRYFNRIENNSDWLKKTSANKEKIKCEFFQLQNVPDQLKKYFVESRNLVIGPNESSYETKRVNGLDLSVLLLNDNFSDELLSLTLNQLKDYFKTSFKICKKIDENPLSFVLKKNKARLKELKEWSEFSRLESFIKNFTEQKNLGETFSEVNSIIESVAETLHQDTLVYSHGDLCFSNIIIEDETAEIILIDPRGASGQAENFLTPYYDVAKLSHSLLGGYDLIINNQANISFDIEMIAKLNFSIDLDENQKVFEEFVSSMRLDFRLVRLVEISLFLSMLPIHIENFRKVIMLYLRAIDLLNSYKNTYK
jgi:hypothetical protein